MRPRPPIRLVVDNTKPRKAFDYVAMNTKLNAVLRMAKRRTRDIDQDIRDADAALEAELAGMEE